MSALDLSMLCTLTTPIFNVFNSIVKRIVRYNSIEELPLLYYIINESVVPDDAFKWLTDSMHSCVEVIFVLIKNRLWLDKVIDNTVKLIEKSHVDSLSCIDLEKLLEKNNHNLLLYEKHYIFVLLSEYYKTDSYERLSCNNRNYDCKKPFPVKNIHLNYTPTVQLIDQAICEASRQADYKLLKNIIAAASANDLKCEFDPDSNPTHKEVITWLQENILKGCKGVKNLGWTEGPDSAKWPSTELKDYVKTLNCLYEIMP